MSVLLDGLLCLIKYIYLIHVPIPKQKFSDKLNNSKSMGQIITNHLNKHLEEQYFLLLIFKYYIDVCSFLNIVCSFCAFGKKKNKQTC